MLLSLTIIATKSFTMHTSNDLKPWVKAAEQIKVRTALKYLMNVQINDNSTVFDVKNSLLDMEGIPTEQQALYPMATNWWTLGMIDKRGDKLQDDSENIKQIMNRNNSDRFILYLSLRK